MKDRLSAGWKKHESRRDPGRESNPRPATRNLEPLVAASIFILIVSSFGLVPYGKLTRAHGGVEEPVLLEVGGDAKTEKVPAELKVVSYNIRYRAGDDLKQLIKLLKEDPQIGGAHVIGLQEVDRNKRRTGNVNTARQLAEGLGMRYAWAAPPDADEDGEEETGVAILSVFPLADVTRVLLTHEGPEGRRRVAVGATVEVGKTPVRVYSVHAETRMPVEKKVEHWEAVLEDLRLHKEAAGAIVLGDFNTIKGKDVKAARRLFTQAGFTTPLADDDTTWRTFVIRLKLDWLWLRGLDARSSGIDKDVELSDHWPLWATVKLPKKPEAKAAEQKPTVVDKSSP